MQGWPCSQHPPWPLPVTDVDYWGGSLGMVQLETAKGGAPCLFNTPCELSDLLMTSFLKALTLTPKALHSALVSFLKPGSMKTPTSQHFSGWPTTPQTQHVTVWTHPLPSQTWLPSENTIIRLAAKAEMWDAWGPFPDPSPLPSPLTHSFLICL